MIHHVLVLCTHNSARSALAEGMLNHWALRLNKPVRAHSAGSQPSGRVHPLALQCLRDAGVAVESLRSKSWDEFSHHASPPLSVVITVCDSAAAESCPVLTGSARGEPVRVHWGYPDPSATQGEDALRLRAFELTRQALGFRALQLLALPWGAMDRAALQNALVAIGRS
jgi:arsenate reductase (thioredoxin)